MRKKFIRSALANHHIVEPVNVGIRAHSSAGNSPLGSPRSHAGSVHSPSSVLSGDSLGSSRSKPIEILSQRDLDEIQYAAEAEDEIYPGFAAKIRPLSGRKPGLGEKLVEAFNDSTGASEESHVQVIEAELSSKLPHKPGIDTSPSSSEIVANDNISNKSPGDLEPNLLRPKPNVLRSAKNAKYGIVSKVIIATLASVGTISFAVAAVLIYNSVVRSKTAEKVQLFHAKELQRLHTLNDTWDGRPNNGLLQVE